jgi:hypothetical protein
VTFSCDTAYSSQAEVGEGAVAVEVDDLPRHPAIPDVVQGCSLRPNLFQGNSAPLAASAAAYEYQYALVIQFAVLDDFGAVALPGVQEVAPEVATPAIPIERPGAGPSAITVSMFGCAHSTEL